jgi:hypothetical protein
MKRDLEDQIEGLLLAFAEFTNKEKHGVEDTDEGMLTGMRLLDAWGDWPKDGEFHEKGKWALVNFCEQAIPTRDWIVQYLEADYCSPEACDTINKQTATSHGHLLYSTGDWPLPTWLSISSCMLTTRMEREGTAGVLDTPTGIPGVVSLKQLGKHIIAFEKRFLTNVGPGSLLWAMKITDLAHYLLVGLEQEKKYPELDNNRLVAELKGNRKLCLNRKPRTIGMAAVVGGQPQLPAKAKKGKKRRAVATTERATSKAKAAPVPEEESETETEVSPGGNMARKELQALLLKFGVNTAGMKVAQLRQRYDEIKTFAAVPAQAPTPADAQCIQVMCLHCMAVVKPKCTISDEFSDMPTTVGPDGQTVVNYESDQFEDWFNNLQGKAKQQVERWVKDLKNHWCANHHGDRYPSPVMYVKSFNNITAHLKTYNAQVKNQIEVTRDCFVRWLRNNGEASQKKEDFFHHANDKDDQDDFVMEMIQEYDENRRDQNCY